MIDGMRGVIMGKDDEKFVEFIGFD